MTDVEEVLRLAHRPLTSEEIMSRVSSKKRRSAYKELANMKKRNELVRIEISATVGQMDLRTPIVFYKLIR